MTDTSSPLPKNIKIRGKIRQFFRRLLRQEDTSLRETLEELIEDAQETESSIESGERTLLGNVLNLRDLTAADVMIPRADITAVSHKISAQELLATMTRTGLSRIPVYKDDLDNVIGMISMKDMLAWAQTKGDFTIRQVLREVLFISPSMRTLDLLLQMRQNGSKMALVVDEYGGIDGLVSFSDLIEEIIGDIQTAHDQTPPMHIQKLPDGNVIVDARYELEELEKLLNIKLATDDMDDDIETIGGLVVTLAGHVPVPGELVAYSPIGFEFEVLDADPRRVKRILLRPIPKKIA
jgi:CBS domain containing-hemolysin-like protein